MTTCDSDACAVWVFLVGFNLAYYHGMANFMPPVLWDVGELDEFIGVCAFHALLPWAFWTFTDALAESSKFIGIGGVPNVYKLGVLAKLSVL